MLFIFLIFSLAYQVPLIAAINDDHEYHNQHQLASQCYSYAGGHVYPQEAGGSKGHTLHWSKAQSMMFTIFSNNKLQVINILLFFNL